MAAVPLTLSQYKKKYGAGYLDKLKTDKAALAAAKKGITLQKPSGENAFVVKAKPGQHAQLKKVQAINLTLPHKKKSTLSKLGGKIIKGAAIGIVGAGLASAAATGLGSASSAGNLVSGGGLDVSNMGGFGDILSGAGDFANTIGGYVGQGTAILDQVSGYLPKKKKKTGSKGIPPPQFVEAPGGGNFADSPVPMGPPDPSAGGGGMSTTTMLVLGGAAVLVLVLVMKK